MNSKKKQLLICIAIPLLVGLLSSLITRDGMKVFEAITRKLPLTPPGWLFPVVWTILYLLMGISSYLILKSDAASEEIQSALLTYACQLAVNFLWSTFFFNFQWYFFSFLWLIFLWILILIMILQFHRIVRAAAWMNLPYLIWVTFAGYLNFGIWWLQR